MHRKYIYTGIPILILLVAAKISSSFTNISPFIATIIFTSYFVKNKYYLLIMVFISQALSDLIFITHISNLFVYLSYIFIIMFLHHYQRRISLLISLIHSVYINGIFFVVSNIGHYIFFNEVYTMSKLMTSYIQAITFGYNLFLSTCLFICIYHSLLAVTKQRLARA